MWRAVGTSTIGTSHEKLNLPCQDYCAYYSCILGSDRVLVAAIADGAGSAKNADIGARESVLHILHQITNCNLALLDIDEQTAVGWFEGVRNRLNAVADERKILFRDLDCTLLFAILGEYCSIFGQTGDGAWIIKSETGYDPATWPTRGEYANQTFFVTLPNWRDTMQFSRIMKPLEAVAGFSDGLQDLALHFASQSVHAPFFDSKFSALRNCEDETSLKSPLAEFLQSPALVARTDDDKTLFLACRKETILLAYPNS